MKTLLRAVVFSVSIPFTLLSQPVGPATIIETPDLAWQIVERGANHQRWQSTNYETLPSGATVPHVHSFTELQTGLNYWDGTQWQPAREQIRVFPGGAVASEGQHKVWFPYDIYSGFIRMTLPDENTKPLRSQVVGLSYSDGTESVLIAAVTNSIGQLLPSGNQVLYTNCFSGVTASLRYTYRKDSFEQDVLLESQLPPPQTFGLSSAAYLEVVTEFVDAPQATRGRDADPRFQDVDFGSMTIGRGRAFVMGADENKSADVLKDWVQLDGRQFLFEQVPLPQIERSIRALPVPRQSSIPSQPPTLLRTAQGRSAFPKARIAKASTRMMQMAEARITPGTLVLDYATLNTTLTNYTFLGDAVYYISGNVGVYGTNVTFEGSTVLKYASNVTLSVNCPVTWLGDNYRPVILTAKDDNRVGENISGSTGNPGTKPYAATALYFNAGAANTNLILRNLRIANAATALALDGKSGHILSHVQLYNCGNGILATNTEFKLLNALFYNVQTNFCGSGTGRVEHLTADTANWLNVDLSTNLFLTNCLLVAVTNTGNYVGQNVRFAPSAAGVFQSAGAAEHYLISGSTNRNAGTTLINAGLASDLKKMTTYAPTVISNATIVIATNFNSQAQRDTDTPDLGYHYDPLDWVFGGTRFMSNVTFSAGTAIGWFELPGSGGPGYGLSVTNDMTALLSGTLTQQCVLARYGTVQEGANSLWKDKGWLAAIIGKGYDNAAHRPQGVATFTRFYLLAGDPNNFRDYGSASAFRASNCEFFIGGMGGYGAVVNLTNCLLDRAYIGIQCTCADSLYMRNCTMRGRQLFISHGGATWPVWIANCTFDGVTVNMDDYSGGNTNITYCDYNAFLSGSNRLAVLGAHDVIVSNSFNWQKGLLGYFYLPTNSTLINTGSTTADVLGLYHFTTQTNQVKETNTVVDIGYHYVALDTSGNPVDSNGNGVPDYLEDANGNGTQDGGETNWAVAFAQQPSGLTVIQGEDAGFYALVAGLPTLRYQWYFGGSPVAGATNYLYAIPGATTNNMGSYSLVVTNGYGAVTSATVVLTVRVPPTINWVTPSNGASFNPGDSITNTVAASAYGTSITNVQFFSAYGVKIGQTATTNSAGNYSVVWSNVPAGMYGLTAVATDGYGMSSTSSVVTVTVGSFSFVRGINLNGTNVTIEGNSWWSYSYALTNGLSVSNCGPDSVAITGWTPAAPGDTNVMLQTFLRRNRFPPVSEQTNYQFSFGTDVNPHVCYGFTILTNIPSGLIVTNTGPDCWTIFAGCYRGYLSWCLDDNISIGAINTFQRCVLYYPYGSSDPTFALTNINMVNYILNHKLGSSYDTQNSIWRIINGPVFSRMGNFTLEYTNMVAQAQLFGVHFIPTNGQVSLAMINNSSNQPLALEIGTGTNSDTAVSFTLTQTNLPNGTNYVFLWIGENQSDHTRSLDVQLQNLTVATGIGDLLYTNWAKYGPYPAVVTNGTLTMQVTSPVKGDPILMGLSIYTQSTAQPLSVQFVSPTNNQLFLLSPTNILLTASVSNTSGTVTGVGFFNGTTFLGNGTGTSNIYSLLWTNVAASSNYTLKVWATNSVGTTASHQVSIIVNAMPLVSIVTPTNIQSFKEITNVTLTASAYDAEDGTNLVVGFYTNNVLLNWATNVPGTNLFRFYWTNRHANTYPIVAVATDKRGASTPSSLGLFKVTPTNPPPFVQITWPTNIAVFAPGSDITITAIAYGTNGGGAVTNVEFFVNGESIGNDTNAPYEITRCCWKAGNYSLVAKATDSFGVWAITNITIFIPAEAPAGTGYWDGSFGQRTTTDIHHGIALAGVAIAPDNELLVFTNITEDVWFLASCVADGTNYSLTQVGDFNDYLTMGVPTAIRTIGTNIIVALGAGKCVEWVNGAWEHIGTNLNGSICAIEGLGGDIYVAGTFTAVRDESGQYDDSWNTNVQYIAKLDRAENQWRPVGSEILDAPVLALAAKEGKLYAGGVFKSAGGVELNGIARLDGNTWSPLGQGLTGDSNWLFYIGPYDYPDSPSSNRVAVLSLSACDKHLFVGGQFLKAGNVENVNGVAVWSESDGWSSPGGAELQNRTPTIFPAKPYFGPYGDPSLGLMYYPENVPAVYAVKAYGNSVFVGGDFTRIVQPNASVLDAQNIAQATWDESMHQWTWTDLNRGVNDWQDYGAVTALDIRDESNPSSYDVFVAGAFSYVGDAEIPSQTYALWRVGIPQHNSLPVVVITNPAPSAIFTNLTGSPITITTTITSHTNIQPPVNFYAEGVKIGEGWNVEGNAWQFDWYDPVPGPHLIKVAATDADGLVGTSRPLFIVVNGPDDTITAVDDHFDILMNSGPVELNVLANDSTTTNNPLRLLQAYQTGEVVGSVQVSYDQKSVIYQPSANSFTRAPGDTIAYSVTDGVNTNTAFATVWVHAPPVLNFNSPEAESQHPISTSITVSGSSFGYDADITNTTVYLNGTTVIYQTNGPTFSFAWSTNKPAFYNFSGVASDNYGYTNSTQLVNIFAQDSGNQTASSTPVVTIAVTNNSTATNILTASITNLPVSYSSMGTPQYPIVRDGFTNLLGEAKDSNVNDPVTYQLLLHLPDDSDAFANVTPQPDATGFHQGGDNSGSLGTLDLTEIPNGVYDLELIVHGGGAETNAIARFQLDSQLKIGQFSFSEQDLVLPVSGIPLTVTRTYNSLNPLSGAFGQSWTYALNDMDVQLDEDRVDVTALDTVDEDADLPAANPYGFSLRVGGGRDVTLTLPDGRRTTFYFTLVPSAYSDGSGWGYDAKWTAPPGVTYALTTPNPTTPSGYGDNTLFVPTTSNLKPYWRMAAGLTPPPMEAYDFPALVLSNRDGSRYEITRDLPGIKQPTYVYEDKEGYFGDPFVPYTIQPHPGKLHLSKVIQRSGDIIQVHDNGIFHYTNSTASTPNRYTLFDRDAAGRITAIRDPNTGTNGLPTVKYIYNRDTGNLIQVQKLQDAASGTYTTVKYHYGNPSFPHYITSIEDPRGVPIARNEYDDSGKLIAVVDADGKRTEFIHSTTNKMEVITDRAGNKSTYVYDTRGNVTWITNALNQVSRMVYDDNGNKIAETNALGTTSMTWSLAGYDQFNNQTNSVDSLNRTNSFAYDSFGNLLSHTDPLGNVTENQYDSAGNLIAVVDALKHGTTNFYDSTSLLIGSVDAIGTRTTNFYDGAQNLIGMAMFDASGTILSTNTSAYDLDGNRTNSVVWRRVNNVWTAATTTYIYDAQNRVVQTIDPDGGTNAIVYNSIGKQQATIDKLSRTTSYEYDFQGRMFRATYPDGSQESSAYDSAGNRTNSVDRAGRITRYFYDVLNRVTNMVYADNTTNTTVYDDVGRVARTIDARGMVTAFAYDATGRRTAVTNGVGTSVASTNFFGYDANGNQIYFTNAFGVVTTNVFDSLNRQVQTLFADGTKISTAYDVVGRRVAETNQDLIVTTFSYDGAGRLIAVTNAFGTATPLFARYLYDEAGFETAQIDALGRTNFFTYDGMGRRILHTMPGDQKEGFAYDLGGNTVYQTNFSGVVITNRFDALNRLTNRSSIFGYSVSFAYSPTGQRTNMIDPSGSTAYLHDSRDRLTNRVVSFAGGPSVTLSYGYDSNGNVTNIASSTSGGVSLAYSYDQLSRLTNVLANNSAAATYGFDAIGNLQAARYSTLATNTYQYDSLNRLTNLTCKTVSGTIASFYYQLGSTGNRTNLSETVNGTSRSYQWQYDRLYRLTNEVVSGAAPTGNLGYQYDPVGNRLARTGGVGSLGTQSLSYNTNDWLNSDSYDNNGNTASSAGKTYQYDALNQLTNVNSGTILMTYDGDGNRVSKKVGGVTTYYLTDDRNPSGYVQVLEEYQGSTLNRVYNYGLALISQKTGSTTYFFGLDGHGSTRFLLNTSGGVAETYVYDAYGTLISGPTTPATPYLYCCQQYDSDLGLYYNRARYLNSGTGRFWTMDPLLGTNYDPPSLHRYTYCANNPVLGSDPSGLSMTTEQLVVTGIRSILFAMNAVSFIHNSAQAIQAGMDAVSYFHDQDYWNGLMASGEAVIHGGFAALNLVGMKASFTPPPPSGFATALVAAGGRSGGVRFMWRAAVNNPAFGEWVLRQLQPAIAGTLAVFASAGGPHELDWEHRDSGGRIKARGQEESGNDGQPTANSDWQSQRQLCTEWKVLSELSGVNAGDIITMRGEFPPCNPGNRGCFWMMEQYAKRNRVTIIYGIRDGNTWVFKAQ